MCHVSAEPIQSQDAYVVGMHVEGGYSDGEHFLFNEGLTCIIGPNYAGKSAVLDYIRFGLGQEADASEESRLNLLDRLQGILTEGGVVELYVRSGTDAYAIRREFIPEYSDDYENESQALS